MGVEKDEQVELRIHEMSIALDQSLEAKEMRRSCFLGEKFHSFQHLGIGVCICEKSAYG